MNRFILGIRSNKIFHAQRIPFPSSLTFNNRQYLTADYRERKKKKTHLILLVAK
jgi:hypothetical protein